MYMYIYDTLESAIAVHNIIVQNTVLTNTALNTVVEAYYGRLLYTWYIPFCIYILSCNVCVPVETTLRPRTSCVVTDVWYVRYACAAFETPWYIMIHIQGGFLLFYYHEPDYMSRSINDFCGVFFRKLLIVYITIYIFKYFHLPPIFVKTIFPNDNLWFKW